jgi:guanylate kinase
MARSALKLWLSLATTLWISSSCCLAFFLPPVTRTIAPRTGLAFAYVPQQDGLSSSKKVVVVEKKPLYPLVGDIVRYSDLDGGKADGQILVGKITYIQKQLGAREGQAGWLVDLAELEDTGDGYYGEYSRRRSKTALRNLSKISPIAASFVKSENAFKVPRDLSTGFPLVRAEQYDWEDYLGPFSGLDSVNQQVVQTDAMLYSILKNRVLKFVAVTGAVGTIAADLAKGPEDAAIYFCGALASVIYLFLLSVKTDTIASPDSKFGKNIANLRFLMPLFLVVGVALYNQSLGDANPVLGKGTFDYITAEQFGAAILGFLTYRLPLFAMQILDAYKEEDGELILPGSAGIAMKLAKEEKLVVKKEEKNLVTVFLVSGPQATGRPELVKRLIQEGQGRFVEPKTVDQIKDPATFERMEQRDEFLSVSAGRYGYTKDGILTAAKEAGSDAVVVVDADVEFSKKLTAVSGLRLVGVWVGLNSVAEFERRLEQKIESGEIELPEDEPKASVVRARIKEIVQEVEYGISSGVFEFTVLNEDDDDSIRQLKEASNYCF